MASRSSFALTAFGTLMATAPLTAPQRDSTRFHLDIPSIMRGTETVGREPAGVRWSSDSRWIYFQWLPVASDWRPRGAIHRNAP